MNKEQMKWKIKTTARRVEVKAKEDAIKVKNWCVENPEEALMIGGVIVGAVGYIGKAAIKNVNLRKAEAVKNLYCYDRSLGHYWELKRKLSNQEWVLIDQRKKNGERLADILASMNVLK